MQFKEAMAALEKAGTAQNRKIYPRHGIGGQMFGVSYSTLGALAKSIGRDHALARELFASGNHDARALAMKIADPAQATVRELEAWAKDLDNYVITDAFSGYAAKTSFARVLAPKWIAAKSEWVGRAGWQLYAHFAMDEEPTPDAEFEALLATIVRDIHGSKNRVRDAMNMTMIAIGGRNPSLTAKALAAAKQIGVVEVDHGETGCKTPDAAGYIARMLAHKKTVAARKAAKTTPKKKG
ncbi:MAG: DNA alkylation repair protein [bacterium]